MHGVGTLLCVVQHSSTLCSVLPYALCVGRVQRHFFCLMVWCPISTRECLNVTRVNQCNNNSKKSDLVSCFFFFFLPRRFAWCAYLATLTGRERRRRGEGEVFLMHAALFGKSIRVLLWERGKKWRRRWEGNPLQLPRFWGNSLFFTHTTFPTNIACVNLVMGWSLFYFSLFQHYKWYEKKRP